MTPHIVWIYKTTNYTAVSGENIIANTSSGSFTITLPATPSIGDYISLMDGNDWGIHNLTIGRNGNTINNVADDLLLDVRKLTVDLAYDGSTWSVFVSIGNGGESTSLSPFLLMGA